MKENQERAVLLKRTGITANILGSLFDMDNNIINEVSHLVIHESQRYNQ
jgi:hypothetical protein